MKKKSKNNPKPSKAGRKAALAVASGWPLRWDCEYDDNDNTVLFAIGGSSDGESGDLYYRLRQEVRNNMHCWVEASDPELMIDEEGPLRWPKKYAARHAIECHHASVVRDWTYSANNPVSESAP